MIRFVMALLVGMLVLVDVAPAYAQFQASRGEVADGFITKASYEELAAATR